MPVSKLKAEVARLLRDNHYIADFKILDDGAHGVLRLYLKYHNELPVIREMRRVSTPGLRRYVKCRELPRVARGRGAAWVAGATMAGGAVRGRTRRLNRCAWRCSTSTSGPQTSP